MTDAKRRQYLICNWNERAFGIIIQLHSDLLRFGKEDYKITVINRKEINTAQLYQSYGKYFYNVKFHYGDPSDRAVLSGAGVDNAISVIVLAETNNAQSADAKTMLTFLALKKLREELSNKIINVKQKENIVSGGDLSESKRFGVILEFIDEDSIKNHFKNILESEKRWVTFLYSNIVDSMLFGQSARTPGIVKLFFDLLTFSNETNEVYTYKMPKELLNKTSKTNQITFEKAFQKVLKLSKGDSPIILMGAIKNGILHINPEPQENLILDQNSEILILSKEPISFTY